MKALWTALILLATPLTLLAQVSKEEVRRLLDAHVSDATIVSYVQRNGPMDPLTIDDLSDLKNAGASDDLLRSLIEASRTSSGPQTPPAGSTVPYSTESSTVIYDTPQYSYYYPSYSYSYPAYAPYYPTYYYSSYYPYRYRYYPSHGHSYPYTYSHSGNYGHPYTHNYGYHGTRYPTTVTNPRVPVQPQGVGPYRQSTQQPRMTAPPPSTARPQAPVQSPAAPRGGGGVPRR
jgi:hypothetical protein